MIAFSLTGKVVAIPRSGQFTTEFMRASIERTIAEGKKVYTRSGGWEEPKRYGIGRRYEDGQPVDVRCTTLRVETDGGPEQTADLWITEERVGKATFERVLALEVGARVKITGTVKSTLAYNTFSPQADKVKVLSHATRCGCEFCNEVLS
jgi:hypothetical protein